MSRGSPASNRGSLASCPGSHAQGLAQSGDAALSTQKLLRVDLVRQCKEAIGSDARVKKEIWASERLPGGVSLLGARGPGLAFIFSGHTHTDTHAPAYSVIARATTPQRRRRHHRPGCLMRRSICRAVVWRSPN